MKKADIGVGIVLLCLSAWVFWTSYSYRHAVLYVYGPNVFPQVVSILLAICAIVLIVRALQGKFLSQLEHIDPQGFVRMMIAVGLCIAYLFLMHVIGFAIATCIFLFVLMTFLQQEGMVKRIVSSVSVSLVVWAIFRYFLVIPIPSGMLSFTF